jgi:hypothetical protein
VGSKSVDQEAIIVEQGPHAGGRLEGLRSTRAHLLPLDGNRVATRGPQPVHLVFYL